MLARSVTFNILGQAGALLVGFVASIVLARLLGPSDRGLLALLQSSVSVVVVLAGVSLPFAVAYYGSRSDRRTGAILGTTLAWAALMAVVLVPLAWVARDALAAALSHGAQATAWVVAAAIVPVTFLDYTTQNQVLGQKRFGLYNAIVVVSKAAGLAAVLLLVAVAGLGVTGGLIALAVGSLTTIGLALRPVGAEGGRPTVDVTLLRRMLAYGARVQVGAIFTTLNYRLDVLVLQFFRPLRDVGYYVIAQIMAELVTMLSSGFGLSVLPLVTAADEKGDATDLTLRSLRHHGTLTVVAIVLDAVFGTAVVWWAYGADYHPAIVPMLVLLPGMWFLGTGTVVTNDLRGRGRPGTASALAGAAVTVTVLLDLLLIPPFGVLGAAVASVCAYTVLGVASLITLARVVDVPVRALLPARSDLSLYRELALGLVRRARATPPTVDPAA
ncbi:MAG TPA: oligosaccharide flippase family protein [Gaiellaceae bacterium]